MSAAALYSPALLALAVELADHPLAGDWPYTAESRAKACGSTLILGFACDDDGRIGDFGMKVTACAVGQAAAAIFAGGARGRTMGDLDGSVRAIRAWLAGDAPPPDWPRLAMLEPAVSHPGRYDAILLPWRAAALALSKAPVAG